MSHRTSGPAPGKDGPSDRPGPRGPDLFTERLVLTPLGIEDITELLDVFRRPEIRRYLWDDKLVSRPQVTEVVRANEQLFAGGQAGIWGVRLRATPELLGFAGFWSFFEPPVRELLFGLIEVAWGRGLAFEASSRVLAEEPPGATILASTDRPNERAHRLLERLGFSPDEDRQAQTDQKDPDALTVHYRRDG